MNKTQFVEAVARKANINKKAAESAVRVTLDVISDVLRKNDRIILLVSEHLDARIVRQGRAGIPAQVRRSRSRRAGSLDSKLGQSCVLLSQKPNDKVITK